MKSLVEASTPANYEPDFVLRLYDAEDRRRLSRSALLSVILHIVATGLLLTIDFEASVPRNVSFPQITRRVTLVAPPMPRQIEPTQKAPNKAKPSKEIDLAGLLPRPETKAPPARAALSPRPRPAPAAPPTLPDAPRIELPKQEVAQLPPQGFDLSKNAPPPPPPPKEKPKLAFENVTGSDSGSGNKSGAKTPDLGIQMPSSRVDEVVARVIQKPGGHLVVGDETDIRPSIAESLSRNPSPGRMGSSLELLSDPQGADFRPYLIKVLSAVRRNWFAVIPESARFGRQGRVVIQFAINRDGAVPKLVIAVPSGADPLDRAAVAGISASNPFPPLPSDFRGDQIRLQLSFVYNMPR